MEPLYWSIRHFLLWRLPGTTIAVIPLPWSSLHHSLPSLATGSVLRNKRPSVRAHFYSDFILFSANGFPNRIDINISKWPAGPNLIQTQTRNNINYSFEFVIFFWLRVKKDLELFNRLKSDFWLSREWNRLDTFLKIPSGYAIRDTAAYTVLQLSVLQARPLIRFIFFFENAPAN